MSYKRCVAPCLLTLALSAGAPPAFAQGTATGAAATGAAATEAAATEAAATEAAATEAAATTDTRQSLAVSATVAQAYDDDVPLALAGTIDPTGLGLGGHSTMLIGGVDYSWRIGQVRAGTTGASSLRYFSSGNEVRAINHSAGLGISAPLGRRTSLFANQIASYSPSYLFGLFPQDTVASPGGIQPIAPDYFINDFESMSYGTTVVVTQRLTRRSSFSVSGDMGRTRFLEDIARNRNLRTYSVAGRFSRSLARNATFNAGYRYLNGDFGFAVVSAITDQSSEHTIDAGIEYNRPLSATRRVTFSGGFGSSIVKLPTGAPSPGALTGGQYRGLSGQAAMSYQLGRSWVARGAFRRSIEYMGGLTEPVMTNASSVGVGGLLTRKLDLSSSLGYSSGDSILSRTELLFETYTGNVKLQYAVNNTFAVFAQYLYYFYDFRQNAQLPANVPVGLERNGVRAGLTLRVPISPR